MRLSLFLSAILKHMSLRTSAHTGVALSKDSLRSQSVLQSLPLGEGGSRVSRKRETDEGLASPYGRGARSGRRGFYFPSQSLRDSSPRVGAKGKRIANQCYDTGSQ